VAPAVPAIMLKKGKMGKVWDPNNVLVEHVEGEE
jgi:hypothetical protein